MFGFEDAESEKLVATAFEMGEALEELGGV